MYPKNPIRDTNLPTVKLNLAYEPTLCSHVTWLGWWI